MIIEYGGGDSIRIQNFFKGNQSLARTMSMANEVTSITVNQELHSLISVMASFDSGNSANGDFMVTDQSLSRPMLTTSSY